MQFNMTAKELFGIYSIVIADRTRIQIDTLKILYLNTDTFVKDHLEGQIAKMMDEFNRTDLKKYSEDDISIIRDDLSNYYGLSQETKQTLSNYMIVAAFSYYEKGIKRLLELTGKLSAKDLFNCYKEKEITKHLKSKFTIDIITINSYIKIEELRCLNNDIKHNGFVGSNLVASNPTKWHLDQAINDTYPDFERLMDAPFEFLIDLADKIENIL